MLVPTEANLPLQHNKKLVTITYNSSKFWECSKDIMDNEAFMETKTNDDDYIPGESIIYSLELNDV
jgi:hypothetical protein